MHPAVYRVFEEICRQADLGGPVLEIGAVAGPDSLLHLDALRSIGPRIGLNLEGGSACDGYDIVQGNANDMSRFADGRFRPVLGQFGLVLFPPGLPERTPGYSDGAKDARSSWRGHNRPREKTDCEGKT